MSHDAQQPAAMDAASNDVHVIAADPVPHQFALFRQRRFLPFFSTQFLGAFNDNLFKIALVLWVTYSPNYSDDQIKLLGQIANGIFILPFFLFSATCGQLADKLEKSRIIRLSKLLEIFIMLVGAAGFYMQNLSVLLFALFLMGTQSTLFGPVKYAILPQHLHREELLGGNGLVEMGTFVAILLGQLTAGVLLAMGQLQIAALTAIAVAVLGWWTARKVPLAPATDPHLKINWNFLTETGRLLKYTAQQRVVLLTVLGISWFWFFGAILLAQIPSYARLTLHGDESVTTLLFATFSIAIGLGSVLCEKLSQGRVELGLVPFGSIGLTAFGIDLWAASDLPLTAANYSALAFVAVDGAWRILFGMFGIGVFGGFYIVPLYTMMQTRSERSHLSRVIASNNVLNALFMVAAALLGAVLLGSGVSIPQLFLIVAIMNAAVVIYIYKLMPEFTLRFFAWLLINTVYRLTERGKRNVPLDGACVLVSNHVSFADALVIAAAVPRPVRFVMDHRIFRVPVLSWLFRSVNAIPIASAKEDPEMKARAFEAIAAALQAGEAVVIFPEGRLSPDGEVGEFRPGIEQIIARTPVPVIPMGLRGLWTSYFSRRGGSAFRGVPWKLWKKIGLDIGEPWAPEQVNAAALRERVIELRGRRK